MVGNRVLIITSSFDKTVDYIISLYPSLPFFRFNVDQFADYSVSISQDGWQISSADDLVTDTTTLSIYYRKPILPDLSNIEPSYHTMIQRDIISVINGICDSFDGRVLTKPSILRKTENKIFQLLTAKDCGFVLPVSSITNQFRHLGAGDSQDIIKPISTGKVYGSDWCELYQTKYVDDSLTPDISLTPVYLQEYVNKDYEVRLTVINGHYYTVRIDTSDKLDWRSDYSKHRYSMVPLQDDVKGAVNKLMEEYELIYGAFDFIVKPDGTWIYLEVNPNGQWQWLEVALSLDISKGIVDYLTYSDQQKDTN